MKLLKIDVLKINKKYLFQGAKGLYLDCVMWDGKDDHGNDGWINQSIPREIRETLPIEEQNIRIGTWKELAKGTKSQKSEGPTHVKIPPKPLPEIQVLPAIKEDEDIPF